MTIPIAPNTLSGDEIEFLKNVPTNKNITSKSTGQIFNLISKGFLLEIGDKLFCRTPKGDNFIQKYKINEQCFIDHGYSSIKCIESELLGYSMCSIFEVDTDIGRVTSYAINGVIYARKIDYENRIFEIFNSYNDPRGV
jgi:hypothetical protein